MNSQTGLSILRTVLTLVGSFIVGHAIFGHTVSADIWSVISGATAIIGSSIWGIYDKSATVDGLTSAVRSVIITVGGLFVAAGRITADNLTSILGLAAAVLPALLSHLDRVKTTAIATGYLVATATTTGKVTTTGAGPKVKTVILILLSVGIASSCSAQSIFKQEPKFNEPISPTAPGNKMSYAHIAPNTISATDSILNVYRFGIAVSPTGFTFSGVYQASAGLELGIQHQDYNYASQTYSVLWSANLVWIPINTGAPIRSIKDLETFGALYGPNLYKILGIKSNNVFQIGPFYNPNTPGSFKDKAGVWVVIGINLN